MLSNVTAEKRAAPDDLMTGAKRESTLTDHSMSQQAVGSRMSDLEKSDDSALSKMFGSLHQLCSVPKAIIDRKKEDSQLNEQTTPDDLFTGALVGDAEESLVNHPSSVARAIIDHKKDDSLLKEHNMLDQLSAGSSAQLSYVASHVDVKFKDCSNIIPAHSRPDAKSEDGELYFTVKKISDLGTETRFSRPRAIGNLTWKIGVSSTCQRRRGKSDIKFVSLFVYCDSLSSSNLWSCDADIQFNLQSSRTPFIEKTTHKFEYSRKSCGFHQFLEWNQLMDPENGYVNNDIATIQVQLTIKKIIGFREFSEFDFVSDAPRSNSDIVLIVGGQRICVCKYYLSIHSPVFHAMFFSEFIERDMKEIVLEDIEPDEFIELLNVIYPTHKPVTDDNVDSLLELGDRFEVRFVMEECERFLIATNEVSNPQNLACAGKYRLANLQDVCLKTIKGLDDVKALMKHVEWKEYSHETKSAILEQLKKVLD